MKGLMAGAALALIGVAAAAQDCDIHNPATIADCLTEYRAAMTRLEEAEAAAPFFAQEAISACSENLMPDVISAAACAENEHLVANEIYNHVNHWREVGGDSGEFVKNIFFTCLLGDFTSMEQLNACLDAVTTRQRVILDMASVIRPSDTGYVETGRWTIDPSVQRATLAGVPLPRCGAAQPIVTLDCTPDGLQVRLQTTCAFHDDGRGTPLVMTDQSGRDFATFTMHTNEADNVAVEARPTTALRLAQALLAGAAEGDIVISFNDAEGERRRLTFPQASILEELSDVGLFCSAGD